MILADENIDHSLIARIRQEGFEVYSIYESNRGYTDESVIELSRNPPRIILTEDKDFGEWVSLITFPALVCCFYAIIFKTPKRLLKLLSNS